MNLAEISFGRALVLISILVCVLSSNAVRAETKDPAKNTESTSTASAVLQKQTEESEPSALSLQLLSFFYGPPVTNPTSNETPVPTIGYVSGLSVQNQLGLKYEFQPDWSLTPTADFEYRITDPFNKGTGQSFALTYDSFIKLMKTSLVNFNIGENNLNFDLDLRYYVPTSTFSREHGTLGSARVAVNPSYYLPHSNFSFSAVGAFRYYFQQYYHRHDDRTSALAQTNFYAGPQVNYRVNDSVMLWSLFELSVTLDTVGGSTAANPQKSIADIEPGVDIKVTKGIYISPYLNWFTNQDLGTTSLNMTASLSI
jgi:hypothetical protein